MLIIFQDILYFRNNYCTKLLTFFFAHPVCNILRHDNTIRVESFNFPTTKHTSKYSLYFRYLNASDFVNIYARTESEKNTTNIYSDGTNKYTNNTLYLLRLRSFGD